MIAKLFKADGSVLSSDDRDLWYEAENGEWLKATWIGFSYTWYQKCTASNKWVIHASPVPNEVLLLDMVT